MIRRRVDVEIFDSELPRSRGHASCDINKITLIRKDKYVKRIFFTTIQPMLLTGLLLLLTLLMMLLLLLMMMLL
jgi:hypothetical protein